MGAIGIIGRDEVRRCWCRGLEAVDGGDAVGRADIGALCMHVSH